MVSNNPPPPPQENAWDKPITHAFRAQSPNVNKPVVQQSNNRVNRYIVLNIVLRGLKVVIFYLCLTHV